MTMTDVRNSTKVKNAERRSTLDEATLTELYRLHGAYLQRALLRVTNGDRGKAEDILQETFVRAWQHPEALTRGPEHGRPWLFTVARRIAIDHFRMAAARAQSVGEQPEDERCATGDPFDAVLMARDVEVALAQLEPHHREVLVELHMKDRTAASAQTLGIPVGTVKSRNFYAVRALKPVLMSFGMGVTA